MRNFHGDKWWIYLVPFLVGVMLYFVIRSQGKYLVQIILVVLVALILAPFLYLAYGLGGIGGVIEVVCVLLIGSGIGIYVLPGLLLGRLARPISDAFDGGDEPPEAAPFYHIARLRRKEHKYDEAIRRIEEQLQSFPTDFEGQMLLAEVQAEDLRDPAAAEETIEQMVVQDCHPPQLVAQALNKLAEWQLSIGSDKAAAKIAIQRIVELFPNTELAESAAARLSSFE